MPEGRGDAGRSVPAPLAFGGWCLLALVWTVFAPVTAARLADLGYAVAATLVVTAGAMRLVRSRLVHDARAARGSVELIVAGATVLLAGLLGADPAALLGHPARPAWLVADSLVAGVTLGAAGWLLAGAGAGLRSLVAESREQTLRLAAELHETQQRLCQLDERQRERLHDAHSAALGVLGATRLFTTAPPRPGLRTEQLRAMMAAELQRLTCLLDPDAHEQPRTFTLGEVFEPVLLAYRAKGLAVDAELRDLRVFGLPTVTATVLANLLNNAEKHAPGASVAIRAASAGPIVRICVEDDGPGIPAAERELVLSRGARSSTVSASGSGLGLYTAALAMAEQHGSLRVEGRHGGVPGARIVLRLPAADVRLVAPLRARAS